ncbi:hypothetical protein A0O30_19590 [Pseudomonas sp. LLC-1]|nr:hypothetical protein A0O30_19590 [Pseudomonas sp. LLC-1]
MFVYLPTEYLYIKKPVVGSTDPKRTNLTQTWCALRQMTMILIMYSTVIWKYKSKRWWCVLCVIFETPGILVIKIISMLSLVSPSLKSRGYLWVAILDVLAN